MASKKILKQKEATVKEIAERIENSKTFLLLNYQGLTVSEIAELRNSLREVGSDIKVYKNTLMNLALKEKDIKLNDYMSGPNAYLFADSIIEPIKVVSKFASFGSKQIADYSHNERGYRETKQGDVISYAYAADIKW